MSALGGAVGCAEMGSAAPVPLTLQVEVLCKGLPVLQESAAGAQRTE